MGIRLDVLLPASASSLRLARDEVVQIAEEEGADEALVNDIKLCVSEAFANAVRYAYRGGPGDIELGVGSNGRELTVVVRDWGRGFDPKREGLGLKIIARCTSRHLIASVPGGGTEVVMTFDLVEPPGS